MHFRKELIQATYVYVLEVYLVFTKKLSIIIVLCLLIINGFQKKLIQATCVYVLAVKTQHNYRIMLANN